MRLMDGAMGSFLLSHGIPLSACFEELNLSRPRLIEEIHRSYALSGAEIVVSNTFGANSIRLGSRSSHTEKINREGVRIARRGANGKAKVYASIGPLGKGGRKLNHLQKVQVFRQQVRALAREKPDGYLVETMTTLEEAEAASLAVREVSHRRLLTSLTFPKGIPQPSTLEWMSQTLRAAGVDAIGSNCGTHPAEVLNFVQAFRSVDPGPWLARPAAGIPGQLVSPEEFSKWCLRLIRLGVKYIGGCCGTTPAYIRLLKEKTG